MVQPRIEDYALIGDRQTAALIARNGSIDWTCFPRFDSPACFTALLGDASNGRWKIAPQDGTEASRRYYEEDSLVLISEYTTATGTVQVTDFMPERDKHPEIIRIVRGVSGQVAMEFDLCVRCDYGRFIPWHTSTADSDVDLVCAPDRLRLITPVAIDHHDQRGTALFTVDAGQTQTFVLTWYPAHEKAPPRRDPETARLATLAHWREWSVEHASLKVLAQLPESWRQAVTRSLTVLKAMTYAPTGGFIAAVTTSLPEVLGGASNWDYRFCWLRDATLSVAAMLRAGHRQEAEQWRTWLLRTAAGEPETYQIMYGVAGERRLTETKLDWLAGYDGAQPVRIGNAAEDQFQLGTYGDVVYSLSILAKAGVKDCAEGRQLRHRLVTHLAAIWQEPDAGIWEIRGEPQHFTYSKVMAWVAVDRAIQLNEIYGDDTDLVAWRQLRTAIHQEVCDRGYDEHRGIFVQVYGSKNLDASLLRLPLLGFLPATDPRIERTIAAIEADLVEDGLVRRYRTDGTGNSGDAEGAFLACSFWLVGCLSMQGRETEAKALFEKLLALRSDLGLLAEEYDTKAKRQVGNYPQAFSHLSLINAALRLGSDTCGDQPL